MRIWRIFGHPSRHAPHPHVCSPFSSLPPHSPIVWISKLDGLIGTGDLCQGLNSMVLEFGSKLEGLLFGSANGYNGG
eukprot:scaffold311841_cov14-Tisochrysis_lutea.AAC.1